MKLCGKASSYQLPSKQAKQMKSGMLHGVAQTCDLKPCIPQNTWLHLIWESWDMRHESHGTWDMRHASYGTWDRERMKANKLKKYAPDEFSPSKTNGGGWGGSGGGSQRLPNPARLRTRRSIPYTRSYPLLEISTNYSSNTHVTVKLTTSPWTGITNYQIY